MAEELNQMVSNQTTVLVQVALAHLLEWLILKCRNT